MNVLQRLRLPQLNRRFCKLALIGINIVVCLLTLGLLYSTGPSNAWRDFGYLTRPIWDSPPAAFQVINHYAFAKGMSTEKWCELHGWKARGSSASGDEVRWPRVFDAVIFSMELDLLEIRMKELWDAVDMFVIVESDRTFTGLPKNTTFADNRDRFNWAREKLYYKFHPGRLLREGESPFEQEGELRASTNEAIARAGAQADDIIIMADVDEIPRLETIKLLKTCEGWGDVIQLQLSNFLYSFEFYVDNESWRSTVHRYQPGITDYSHLRMADVLLADAGWHCSFCFRHIHEFRFKIRAYSHADRLTDSSLLESERIQQVVCEGDNIFDMFPEAYSFLELARRLGPIERSTSMLDLPSHVISNAERFSFLLPNGCERDE